MNSTTILHNLSPDELAKQFQRLEELITKIASTVGKKQIDEFVTREETAEILRIDLSTLHLWSDEGYLKKYKVGRSKVLYKLQEVLDSPKYVPPIKKRKK